LQPIAKTSIADKPAPTISRQDTRLLVGPLAGIVSMN
jgi:hypothetical protein